MERRQGYVGSVARRHSMAKMDIKKQYNKDIVPALMKEFGHKNKMAVPKLDKVIVNTGFGRKTGKLTGEARKKFLSLVEGDLALMTGQKPVLTKAKKSIAGFSLREGQIVGSKVTLRRDRMYDMIGRLIHIALPRSRDFQGLERSVVDSDGNLTIGIRDQMIFPEVDIEGIKDSFSFQITVKTNKRNREEAIRLFELIGFPLKKEDVN